MNAYAAIFDHAGTAFRIAKLPLPSALQAGELIVEIALATIRGSGLHTHSGRRLEPTPCVLGHEGVGRVIAAGDGRERWTGRRVTWSSADGFGQCTPWTQRDLPQKCERVLKKRSYHAA
jgi:D-arabinose 1-dehydrogenase-like Zn-dependent alcohol dehydrogenase